MAEKPEHKQNILREPFAFGRKLQKTFMLLGNSTTLWAALYLVGLFRPYPTK
jgi:hypothetical protein